MTPESDWNGLAETFTGIFREAGLIRGLESPFETDHSMHIIGTEKG